MNNLDYSSSGVQFQYQSVTVDRAYPFGGPTEGNTTVVITGHNFAPPCANCYINKDLWCKVRARGEPDPQAPRGTPT